MKWWQWLLFLIVPGILIISALILVLSPAARIKVLQNFALLYPKLRGIRNNNPGNLRAGTGYTWEGQTGKDSKNFAVFESAEAGIRALMVTALHKQTRDGLDTLRALGLSWAPPADNSGASDYGQHLAAQLKVDQDDPFDLVGGDPFTVASLAKAIIKNEEGINPYPDSMFQEVAGVALAKIQGEETA